MNAQMSGQTVKLLNTNTIANWLKAPSNKACSLQEKQT